MPASSNNRNRTLFMSYTKSFLLINPHIADSDKNVIGYRYFPLGLGILAAILEENGAKVAILDIRMGGLDKKEVTARLEEMLPRHEVIGISAIINSLSYVIWLSAEIKRIKPSATIILGGSICTSILEILADRTSCDIFCIGEGEITIIELAEYFEGRMRLEDIKGIAYRDKPQGHLVITAPRQRIENLDAYPFPAYHLFDTDAYVSMPSRLGPSVGKNLTIIAGRGCPFNCTYCLPAFGHKLVLRSSRKIVAEIKLLQERYGIEHIDFIDDLLCFKEDWMREFAQTLIDEKVNITWRGLGRANAFYKFAENTVALMKQAGCHWIGFGFESASQKILDSIKKRNTVEQMQKSVDLCRKFKINVTGTFIMGLPGETEETIAETAAFIRDNYLWPAFSFACPYPGTELYEYAKSLGLLGNEVDFIMRIQSLYDLYVVVCDMTEEELRQHHKAVTGELTKRLQDMGVRTPTMLMGFERDATGETVPLLDWKACRITAEA